MFGGCLGLVSGSTKEEEASDILELHKLLW